MISTARPRQPPGKAGSTDRDPKRRPQLVVVLAPAPRNTTASAALTIRVLLQLWLSGKGVTVNAAPRTRTVGSVRCSRGCAPVIP